MADLRLPASPPQSVLDYFRGKRLAPAFSWLDVWGEEHAYSFTVAKAVENDLLVSFRDSIDRAIAEGQSFATWRDGIEGELKRLGWWGGRTVNDPDTGETKTVDFSRPRRLATIFNSNMRAARAAGQWERAQRTKAALPYFLYVPTTSHEPRVEHLTWAGTILPIDDPWWDSHMPPNGWGCKCSVRQISRAEAETRGGPTEAPPSPTTPFRNRRTGVVTEVPEGIDPGWHTNPGKARARTLVNRLAASLDDVDGELARRQIAELWSSPFAGVVARLPERVRAPVAISDALAEALDARGPLVVVSNDTVRVKSTKHAVVDLGTFARLQDMLDKGTIVDQGQAGRRSVLIERDDGWWRIVVGRSAASFLRVVTVHRIDTTRALRLLGE